MGWVGSDQTIINLTLLPKNKNRFKMLFFKRLSIERQSLHFLVLPGLTNECNKQANKSNNRSQVSKLVVKSYAISLCGKTLGICGKL
ncbi:MAG: hypothetical protein ACI9J3_001281 [Parvicellaceae bacterium]|jgi:hypothetical protein